MILLRFFSIYTYFIKYIIIEAIKNIKSYSNLFNFIFKLVRYFMLAKINKLLIII